MSQKSENRNPDEIEADIYETRAHLDDTLHELENRLSPKYVMDGAYEYVRNGGANEFFANLGRTIKENPVPFLLTGIGLGWLMMAHRKSQQKPDEQERYDSPYDKSGYRSSTTMPARPTESTRAPSPSDMASTTANRPVDTTGHATTSNSIKGTQAVHTGTTEPASSAGPRPDTVGEATHLGTHQGQDSDTPKRA